MNYRTPKHSNPINLKMPTLKALLIEDNHMARVVLTYMLDSFGYQVDIAEDGKTALRLLRENSYVLVLTDIGLPDISGIEVIQQFRQYNKTTKIIVQSAHVNEEITKECLTAGCNAVLSKPITAEILQAKIDSL